LVPCVVPHQPQWRLPMHLLVDSAKNNVADALTELAFVRALTELAFARPVVAD
jgi:hypothetical protein